MKFLNMDIMKEPMNWVIVFGMVLFWLILFALLLPQSQPASA
jgi:hypothetical protein